MMTTKEFDETKAILHDILTAFEQFDLDETTFEVMWNTFVHQHKLVDEVDTDAIDTDVSRFSAMRQITTYMFCFECKQTRPHSSFPKGYYCQECGAKWKLRVTLPLGSRTNIT
jgi:hypothetical protein